MPTYGYECLGCARSFEAIQKITDDTLTQCDVCGGVLKKKIFPVGVVFKGSGFYVNDYAKKSSTPEPSAPAKTETTASATDTAAAPSDTAAKSSEPAAAPAAPAATTTGG